MKIDKEAEMSGRAVKKSCTIGALVATVSIGGLFFAGGTANASQLTAGEQQSVGGARFAYGLVLAASAEVPQAAAAKKQKPVTDPAGSGTGLRAFEDLAGEHEDPPKPCIQRVAWQPKDACSPSAIKPKPTASATPKPEKR